MTSGKWRRIGAAGTALVGIIAAGCGESGSEGGTAGALGGGGALAGTGGESGDGSGGTAPSDPKEEPAGFWDASDVPAAKEVLTFRFLNRSHGQLRDDQLFWRFQIGDDVELHSFAEQPTFDMPANSSGRLYFYACPEGEASCDESPENSKYFDFIEHTIGENQYNGNTTRVDAFGLKIAMRLHCADGFEETVGEDYGTFLEDRATTFQKFRDFVPDEFDALAEEPFAPYRIVEPGAGGFNEGGAHADYYSEFIDAIWDNNGLTVPKPGPNGSGLGAYPDLSAAIYRHVGDAAGTFAPDGHLLDTTLWSDATTFYSEAPANYYAAFFHLHGIDGKAYGFPYDDVGSYSTYISHSDPDYLLIAVGF